MTTIEHLYRADYSPQTSTPSGQWVPARPYDGFVGAGPFARLRDAWAVFRGRAEAVAWPEQRAEGRTHSCCSGTLQQPQEGCGCACHDTTETAEPETKGRHQSNGNPSFASAAQAITDGRVCRHGHAHATPHGARRCGSEPEQFHAEAKGWMRPAEVEEFVSNSAAQDTAERIAEAIESRGVSRTEET